MALMQQSHVLKPHYGSRSHEVGSVCCDKLYVRVNSTRQAV